MREDLLQFIWKYQRYNNKTLTTVDKQSLAIIEPGQHNTDQGPDFLNAKIKVGDTIWAGQVEIHVKASDWIRHHHSKDPNYKNVILHVVFENDMEVGNFPVLELKHRIPKVILDRYGQLQNAKKGIPCSAFVHSIDKMEWNLWLERILIERLHNKYERIKRDLESTSNNWNETFHKQLCYSLGLSKNHDAFKLLAEVLPANILAKYGNSAFQLEALVFGAAGFLKAPVDEYSKKLSKEFDFLARKYTINPIPVNYWKFSKLRPSSLPHVRLAQLAAIYHKRKSLFQAFQKCSSLSEIDNLLTVSAAEYWNDHYRFGVESSPKVKSIGKLKRQTLIINTVIPMLFAYAKWKGNIEAMQKVAELLRQLPSEKNAVINRWKDVGISAGSAFESQSLIYLHKQYCQSYKCLSCRIGSLILQPEKSNFTK